MKTTIRLWTRWTPLLALTATLAACGAAVAPDPATTAPATPAPADRQATCVDSGIYLPGFGLGIHGAIVSDILHMGGATAPATCTEPANQSLAAGLPPIPAGRTEQAQQAQSRYYLIVINYPGGNRLYVVSRRPDGTSCVVDTNDQCIAQVTDLPDDFDLKDLPEDVRPTIPAGRPAPPTVDPQPGGGDSPAGPGSPPGGDGAPAPEPGTAPDAAGTPQPSTGATGVAVGGPLLSWAAAPRALSYDVYWGTTTEWGTPINTSSTFVTIGATASLEHETLYFWRVDAKNEAGTTRGTVWSFTTAAAPAPAPAAGAPGAASNPWPPDGASRVTRIRTMYLTWDAAPGAVSYDVYAGTNRDFTADSFLKNPYQSDETWPVEVVGKADPDFAVYLDELQNGTRYYWRVDTKTEAGTIRGDVWSFTTTYGVSNRQPSDGATGVTVDGPLLSWDAAPHASQYEVWWSTSKKSLATVEGNYISTSSTSVRLPALAHETRYYWEMVAVTSDSPHDLDTTPESVWEDIWSFTTAAAPTTPAPPSPGGGG